MADKRDEQNENEEPKIRIVDRRMLNEDERSGKPSPAGEVEEKEPPKLEIIGGGAPRGQAPEEIEEDDSDEEGDDELSSEEHAAMNEQVENEQFAALEQQMGRPLTSQEKDQVREEMKKQAEQASRLEVGPVLMQLMAELSARAAVHLGLMPNPYTKLIARNDTQARLAVESYSAVFDVVKNQLDEQSRKEFERVLNDLRANFSSITGSQAGMPSIPSGPRIIH